MGGFMLAVCFVIASTAISAANVTVSWAATVSNPTKQRQDGFTNFLPSSSNDSVLNGIMVQKDYESTASMEAHEKRDVDALLCFKKALTSDPHGSLSNWTAQNKENVCSWNGISCRKYTRRVVGISLPDLGLEGTLSPCMGNLSLLNFVEIFYNKLRGRIPSEFGKLKALRYLHLNNNLLSGPIPFEAISNLTKLKGLTLAANMLTGSIPETIVNLNQLGYLNLGSNMLTGNIPEAITNMTTLDILILSYNNIGGRIPKHIGKLQFLHYIDLGSNNLRGKIPHSIGELKNLRSLYLDDNNLSNIPNSIGGLVSLYILNLSNNNISGRIPHHINGLVSLGLLDFSKNNLNGFSRNNISGLVSINSLDLSKNNFQRLPYGIENCTMLESLDVSHNLLFGTLEISFPYSLKYFSSHSNQLSGTLPLSLAKCTHLQLLDLRENNLTGEISVHFTNFHELRVLSIAHNNFYGSIPQSITNLFSLQVLDLSNNKFNGRIPSTLECFGGFRINKSSIDTPYDTLYYELRIDMKGGEYSLPYVLLTNTILDLSTNNFMGEIPASMGSLSSLRLLNLSGNQLDGRIPASLSNISTLEQLDLAKNNLSGPIPQDLSQLFWLASLNVSSNQLCGPIPTGTQFDTFGETSFQRNKCLCGYPLQPCKHDKRIPMKDDKSKSTAKGWLTHLDEYISLVALVIGMGIGFGGVVVMFIIWEKARNWMVSPNTSSLHGMYRFPK